MTGAPYTSDFRQEYDAETGVLLRRRFFWLLGASGMVYVLSLLSMFLILLALLLAPSGAVVDASLAKTIDGIRMGKWGIALVLGLGVVDIGMYIWAGMYVAKTHMQRDRLLAFTQWALVYRGVIGILMDIIMRAEGFPWALGFYHILACSFLPWTPRQAMRPMGPLLVLNALVVLAFADMDVFFKSFTIALSLFAGAPGILIAWFKQSRRAEEFRVRMMQRRYGELRRELFDARRIHEALFPKPIESGPLRFQYRYQPMRQIGGDYLYAKWAPGSASTNPGAEIVDGETGALNVLLLDVTGHGIAAALTVNRLYGEVERLFAENPHAGPGEVLSSLNKYVHLTLATHSVYVTALCMRVDQQGGVLEYASGGHPPAFLCGVDGRIEQLDSTAFVLGACAGSDFDPAVESRPFMPGDTLLAYTDGAIEARNEQGRMLSIAGFTKIIAGNHGRCGERLLCDLVLEGVERHRAGAPEDDTLLVEITRVVQMEQVVRPVGRATVSA